MTEAQFNAERNAGTVSKDVELIAQTLKEALEIIDEHDPDRNPVRCMRQLRRLLDSVPLRAAVIRIMSDRPLASGSQPDQQ